MAVCRLKLIVFFWICFAVPSILAKSVKYCNKKANYAVKVEEVEISPDPVIAGKQAVFSIFASTGKAISEGKVTIDVSYFGIHVHSQTIDLCEETSCPIPAGDFVLSHSQTLPVFTPPGSYTLKMRMQDSNNQLLTCISFGFNIGYGATVYDS